MGNDYDQITANHYSAFRPLLHQPILDRCITGEDKFTIGLDIGCGTGQSAIALLNYCDKVIGIEPSKEMLEKSIKHPSIVYKHYDGENLEFEDNHFDIITFAGSLYYAKSQEFLDEVIRVSRPFAKIIVYDFEVLLYSTLEKLNVYSSETTEMTYNHQENFSGLMGGNLRLEETAKEETAINITSSNLSHLLLASKRYYSLLGEQFGYDKLYEKIKDRLNQISSEKEHRIKTNMYYTIYKCVKND